MNRQTLLDRNDELRWEMYGIKARMISWTDKRALKELHIKNAELKKERKKVKDQLSLMPKQK